MKYLKKFKIFLCFAIFGLLVPLPISAESIDEDYEIFTISEYEHILNRLKRYDVSTYLLLSEEEYIEMLELENLKKECIENIYEQKKLSKEELLAFNYSSAQIQAIKNFDGSDEMAILASPTVSVTTSILSRTAIKHGVQFRWSWSGRPTLAGILIIDDVAVRWKTCNPNAVNLNTYVTAGTSLVVDYGSFTRIISYTSHNTTQALEGEFNMEWGEGSTLGWAQGGTFEVYVTLPTGTIATMANTVFEFMYGHTTIQSDGVSFSFPVSGGITLVEGSKMCYKEVEVVYQS